MAHFAKIENGIVTNVVVVSAEHEAEGEAFLHSLGLEGTWIQTSFTAKYRKKFAGIGDTYDAERDVFIPKREHDGLVWDEEQWAWVNPNAEPFVVQPLAISPTE